MSQLHVILPKINNIFDLSTFTRIFQCWYYLFQSCSITCMLPHDIPNKIFQFSSFDNKSWKQFSRFITSNSHHPYNSSIVKQYIISTFNSYESQYAPSFNKYPVSVPNWVIIINPKESPLQIGSSILNRMSHCSLIFYFDSKYPFFRSLSPSSESSVFPINCSVIMENPASWFDIAYQWTRRAFTLAALLSSSLETLPVSLFRCTKLLQLFDFINEMGSTTHVFQLFQFNSSSHPISSLLQAPPYQRHSKYGVSSPDSTQSQNSVITIESNHSVITLDSLLSQDSSQHSEPSITAVQRFPLDKSDMLSVEISNSICFANFPVLGRLLGHIPLPYHISHSTSPNDREKILVPFLFLSSDCSASPAISLYSKSHNVKSSFCSNHELSILRPPFVHGDPYSVFPIPILQSKKRLPGSSSSLEYSLDKNFFFSLISATIRVFESNTTLPPILFPLFCIPLFTELVSLSKNPIQVLLEPLEKSLKSYSKIKKLSTSFLSMQSHKDTEHMKCNSSANSFSTASDPALKNSIKVPQILRKQSPKTRQRRQFLSNPFLGSRKTNDTISKPSTEMSRSKSKTPELSPEYKRHISMFQILLRFEYILLKRAPSPPSYIKYRRQILTHKERSSRYRDPLNTEQLQLLSQFCQTINLCFLDKSHNEKSQVPSKPEHVTSIMSLQCLSPLTQRISSYLSARSVDFTSVLNFC